MYFCRCKNKLLGENTSRGFAPVRSVSQSARSITISSNVQQPAYDAGLHVAPLGVQQRLPKTLPNNFMPTHSQRGNKSRAYNTHDHQQGPRGKNCR